MEPAPPRVRQVTGHECQMGDADAEYYIGGLQLYTWFCPAPFRRVRVTLTGSALTGLRVLYSGRALARRGSRLELRTTHKLRRDWRVADAYFFVHAACACACVPAVSAAVCPRAGPPSLGPGRSAEPRMATPRLCPPLVNQHHSCGTSPYAHAALRSTGGRAPVALRVRTAEARLLSTTACHVRARKGCLLMGPRLFGSSAHV